MRTNIKLMSVVVIIMMFFTIATGGCGGGSSGSSSDYNMGNKTRWDTDPDDRNQNNNGNNNQNNNNGNNNNQNNNNNNNSNNGGDNNNNGNGNQNNNNGSPVAINGTWEIVAGELNNSSSGLINQGKSFSYLPGHLETFEIIVKENTGNMYGGYASGFYTVLLRGVNVTGNEDAGYTEISVPFDDGIPPADTTLFSAPLCGGRDFRCSNDNVMIETDEDFYNGEGYKGNTIYEKKYTLIDNSTIKWTYLIEYQTPGLTQTTDMTVELTLKRVK